MPDPTDPTATDPKRTALRSASSECADETLSAPTAPPVAVYKFGPPAAPGEVGTLGPYRVLKELGKGGMGAVYLAVDTRLNRRVALKLMLPEFAAHAASRERFLREARAAAQINHDNVVTVYEADAYDRVPYIAMQFLQGYPLDEYLRKKGTPNIPQVLWLARETAMGLAAAHELGLVHRDIKPANLWLEAPSGRVKVLDFGLARPVDAETELTKSGAVVGTPAYMSPEQARAEKLDHRTDLFSLGAVVYRLCTGRTPFAGPNVLAVLTALAVEEPPPVRELNPNVPPALAQLVHQLLAKDPNHRPGTAAEVAERLRVIAERPDAAPSEALPGSAPLPQVVYAPLQVTMAPGISAFDNLDAEGAEPEAERSAAKPGARTTGGNGIWLGAGAAALLAAVVVVGVIIASGKKNTGAKNDPPDAPIDAKKDNRPAVRPPTPAVPTDPDRRAAEYALSIGGTIRVNNDSQDIQLALDLPRQPFTVTKIWLRDNQTVTDAGLAACAGCPWLRHLDLVRTPVTDAGLAHFKESKNLWILDLDDARQIGDAGLAHFAGSAAINSLWLGGTRVTDVGLAAFANCKNLLNFDVKRTKVTDAGLAHFKGCQNVRQLVVSNTAVTDDGLANFNACKRLTLLDATNTQITDAGLVAFRDCTTLQDVYLSGSRVTARGVADLRAALPKCKVTWSGRAPK